MKHKQKGNIELIGSLVVIAVVMAGGFIFSSISCGNRWSDSGLLSRYGFTTGCMVKHKGAWIPEDRYRAVDE
jgi:hypothetical protein